MSQTNEIEPDAVASSENTKERVGDILRKERITRRITVETIAKDLKLNVKYIKALEANDYDALPAEPYVRVYLKSLAKYLSLDSESIFKQFYRERGVSVEPFTEENPERIRISMKQKEESPNPLLIVAIVLIVLLALFSFIAKKEGWIVVPPPASSVVMPADSEFMETDAGNDSALADSIIPAKPPIADSGETVVAKTEEVKEDTSGKMRFAVSVIRDSVWIQVFSDGESWKNVVYKDQNRTFTARDSFNVHVGNIGAVKLALNGKTVSLQGKGVVTFKIDRTGNAVKWPLSKWNTVFKDRL